MAKLTGPAKKAWDAFSRLKRVIDCLETTGYPFLGVCVTCHRQRHIRYLEAGHCFTGRSNGVLFSRKLVNAQCNYCNMVMHGCIKKYRRLMAEKYGIKKVDAWYIESRKPIHDRDMDFEGREKRYKEELLAILRPLGYHSWKNLLGQEL